MSRLRLFHSTDHGKRWAKQDVTPFRAHFEYGWLSVSPNGKKLGLGIYARQTGSDPWYVYGAIWRPGRSPRWCRSILRIPWPRRITRRLLVT